MTEAHAACSNGHPVEANQSFCPTCGVQLAAPDAEPEPSDVAEATESATQTPVQPGIRRRRLVTGGVALIVVLIILGVGVPLVIGSRHSANRLGAHRVTGTSSCSVPTGTFTLATDNGRTTTDSGLVAIDLSSVSVTITQSQLRIVWTLAGSVNAVGGYNDLSTGQLLEWYAVLMPSSAKYSYFANVEDTNSVVTAVFDRQGAPKLYHPGVSVTFADNSVTMLVDLSVVPFTLSHFIWSANALDNLTALNNGQLALESTECPAGNGNVSFPQVSEPTVPPGVPSTSTPTTTTIVTPVYGTPPELEPTGALSIAAIGEPKGEVVKRVTASLGPPQPVGDACFGQGFTDERWGDLSLVFGSNGTLSGFWYVAAATLTTPPSPLLKVTGSGITLTDTKAQARAAYRNLPSADLQLQDDLIYVPPAMNIKFGGNQIREIVAGNVCNAPPPVYSG